MWTEESLLSKGHILHYTISRRLANDIGGFVGFRLKIPHKWTKNQRISDNIYYQKNNYSSLLFAEISERRHTETRATIRIVFRLLPLLMRELRSEHLRAALYNYLRTFITEIFPSRSTLTRYTPAGTSLIERDVASAADASFFPLMSSREILALCAVVIKPSE